MTQRKYVLTRIAAGDYLLPSNDGKKLYRLQKQIEGPSSGLDWPADKEVWGIFEWTGPLDEIDIENWDRWDFYEGMHKTRRAAVDAALKPRPAVRERSGGKTLDEAIKSMISSN